MSYYVTTHTTLLARLADGDDHEAWREFRDRYGELIRMVAHRNGLQPADCDEVLQEVLMALGKAMPGFRYDPTKGKFRSYLKTVVLHEIFRRSRQKPHTVQLDDKESTLIRVEDDPVFDSLWELEWRQYHLKMAMRTVASEFSQLDLAAFEAYAVAGQDPRAVATQFGLSVDQVYQAKSRILKRLGLVIARHVEEEG